MTGKEGNGNEYEHKKPTEAQLENAEKQPVYAITLVRLDPEKKHIKTHVTFPPTATIHVPNKQATFVFLQVQTTKDGPVFVYNEMPCMSFDIQYTQEGVDHGTH